MSSDISYNAMKTSAVALTQLALGNDCKLLVDPLTCVYRGEVYAVAVTSRDFTQASLGKVGTKHSDPIPIVEKRLIDAKAGHPETDLGFLLYCWYDTDAKDLLILGLTEQQHEALAYTFEVDGRAPFSRGRDRANPGNYFIHRPSGDEHLWHEYLRLARTGEIAFAFRYSLVDS